MIIIASLVNVIGAFIAALAQTYIDRSSFLSLTTVPGLSVVLMMVLAILLNLCFEEEHLKHWLHPLIFAAWTVFLIYLLVSQRYMAFLRPEFGILLAVAHLIAMGFMLAAMTRQKTKELDVPAIFRALVLLVPAVYSMAMPNTMLAMKRLKSDSSEPITKPSASKNNPRFSLRRLKTTRTLRHHLEKAMAPSKKHL